MSSIIDLSYEEALMDTDDRPNLLLYTNNNHNLSSNSPLQNDNFMELYRASNALNIFEFILLNDPTFKNRNLNNNQNELSDSVKQPLINFVQNYERDRILIDLSIEFAKLFDIYLHFIGITQGKFKIISKYSFPDKTKKRKQAFIVLNGDNTICAPLFAHDLAGGIQTVFASDDMRAARHVGKYIDQLNRTDPTLFGKIKENSDSSVLQGSSNDILVDDASTVANDLDSATDRSVSSKKKIENCISGDQIIQQIVQTNHTYSMQLLIQEPGINTDNTDICHQETQILPNVIREEEKHAPRNQNSVTSSDEYNNYQDNIDRVRQADQISVYIPLSASTHLSNTTQVPETISASTPMQFTYGKPEILINPKQDWNIRYPKDLIPKPNKEATEKFKKKSKKQIDKEKEKLFIGLLQGIGSQRSQIQIKVPPRGKRQIYLASTVRTINNTSHSLKVIVPPKTKVNKDSFNRENDLNYLEFDECDEKHYFDHNTKTVYMKITPTEHQNKCKKLPLYMFNLYQTQRLTKDMIAREQLDKCKLAFWLCEKNNGNYTPISDESLSWIITERKKKRNTDPP